MSARLTATVTATAATIGNQQRPATAHNSRTIYANWGYVRPEKRKVGEPIPRLAGLSNETGGGPIQQQSTATPPDSNEHELPPTPCVSWDSGQTPSSASSSGRRGRRFKSGHPDQLRRHMTHSGPARCRCRVTIWVTMHPDSSLLEDPVHDISTVHDLEGNRRILLSTFPRGRHLWRLRQPGLSGAV